MITPSTISAEEDDGNFGLLALTGNNNHSQKAKQSFDREATIGQIAKILHLNKPLIANLEKVRQAI